MPNYRRSRVAGGTYFFTLVTLNRRKLFANEAYINQFKQVVKLTSPFYMEAWVILPDHIHWLWRLPKGDADYSKRIGKIKAGFSARVNPHNAPVHSKMVILRLYTSIFCHFQLGSELSPSRFS